TRSENEHAQYRRQHDRESHESSPRWLWHGLEPQVDGEPEAAARWERGDVDIPEDCLVPEVADLGIQPGIRRTREQVASAQADAGKVGTEQPTSCLGGEVITERDLPELEEAGALDVVARHHAESRESSLAHRLTRACDRIGEIWRDGAEIVEQLGE